MYIWSSVFDQFYGHVVVWLTRTFVCACVGVYFSFFNFLFRGWGEQEVGSLFVMIFGQDYAVHIA